MTARARNVLGELLSQEGKYAEAVAQFDKALAIDPAYEDARHNREITLERSDSTLVAVGAACLLIAFLPALMGLLLHYVVLLLLIVSQNSFDLGFRILAQSLHFGVTILRR